MRLAVLALILALILCGCATTTIPANRSDILGKYRHEDSEIPRYSGTTIMLSEEQAEIYHYSDKIGSDSRHYSPWTYQDGVIRYEHPKWAPDYVFQRGSKLYLLDADAYRVYQARGKWREEWGVWVRQE